jgi:acyl dehydratase
VTISGLEGLHAVVGRELGPGEWLTVEQGMVDAFAALSGDDQWIHVDPVRAASGPYGSTVAHGLLTLSLLPTLLADLRTVADTRLALNYGYDRIRFPAPLCVGSRIRGRVTVTDVSPAADGGVQIRSHITVEVEGSGKPCLVAEQLVRQYLGD